MAKNWLYVGKDSKITAMRKEAKELLDKAQAILDKPSVTTAEADLAERHRKKAEVIIDRASRLIDVLAADAELERQDGNDEGNGKSNGKGKVIDMDFKAKVKAVRERYGLSEDTGDFKDFRDFLKAVAEAPKGSRDSRLKFAPVDKKDMAEGAMATGGALVPPGYLAEVLVFVGEQSIALPRARVLDMSGRDLSIPAIDHTGGASGKSPMFGNVEATWIEEAGLKDNTDVDFKKIELVAHKCVAYGRVSDELMNDSSPSISSVIAQMFGGEVGWTIDYTFLAGNGVGQPLGIIGAAGTFTQVRAVAGAFAYVDAVNMWSHFLPQKGGVWVMSHSVKPQLATFVDAAGNYIWIPSYGAGAKSAPPGTLLGYPVIFTEKTPILGTTGDVLLCDFSQYLVGLRQDVRMEVSIHERFRYDQTCFRLVMRVDGQPWLQETLTIADGATQMSPFVELDAATP